MVPDRNKLWKQYEQYASVLVHIARDLGEMLEAAVRRLPSHPMVKGRYKEFGSYYKKYLKLLNAQKDEADPVITDLVGLRVVCPFLEDLAAVEDIIRQDFTVLELDRKGAHFSFKEFGYESIHLLIKIPESILEKRGNCGCEVAEIQIRTILQDAWAEVEHELVYKAEFTPFDDPLKRKLAAVNASLSLADNIFQEIRTYQRQLNGELGKRRDSFFRKIEEATDGLLFEEPEKPGEGDAYIQPGLRNTIDDLLLNALYAHNKNRFDEAISFYSRILDMKPGSPVTSLIYKHRGMANFAQSSYEAAIEDFSKALELDPESYKAAYYRGVVKSVLRRYSEAIDDFTLSLEIHPYQNFTLYRRGQAYYHLEDYPAALADCEASLALDPDSEGAAKFRNLLQKKLKMSG
ncbi:MAG: tetratricopeptide repeat protein [Treponema sp.]|jgi:putative GTP pyrophosphokinase|nr:tetratricopeptide repeat protein [Treponema sp.]